MAKQMMVENEDVRSERNVFDWEFNQIYDMCLTLDPEYFHRNRKRRQKIRKEAERIVGCTLVRNPQHGVDNM